VVVRLTVVGANHRTAPIELRERFYVPAEEISAAMESVLSDPAVEECAVLSTCNRTECYVVASETATADRAVASMLARRAGLEADSVVERLYRRHDRDAVLHLYRVVSGLDSMVVGEPQIQGQVEEAYRTSREAHPDGVGLVLHRLFQSALSAGGRVRTETAIGEGAASVPAAAVQLVLKVFGSLDGRRALVIGAGEMGEETLRSLLERGIAEAVVTSRTLARAQEAAGRVGTATVRAIPYLSVPDELRSVDVVLASTSAPHPVVTAEALEAARGGAGRPLVVVDIALPRDVEPAVGDLPGVFLYNIDDLQRVVHATVEAREAEGRSAETLLEEELEDFWRWLLAREAVPLIRGIRREAERIRRETMEEAIAGVPGLSPEERERLLGASRLMVQKLLHGPTVGLRRLAGGREGARHLEAARRLFELNGGGASTPEDEGRKTRMGGGGDDGE
jgi:glutamyl-tRNA reductase